MTLAGRLPVAVLVSGRGSNLKALLDAASTDGFPAQIAVVCANKEAPALEYAMSAGIPTAIFRRQDFPTRADRDRAMARFCMDHGAELVVCAGYDAVLASTFTAAFPGRIINVHPSLLPAFAGSMDAPARALAAGVAETGCTVHLVTDDVDQGPVIAQRRVPVLSGDTPQGLHARIQAEEHRLLPEVVREFALSRVR